MSTLTIQSVQDQLEVALEAAGVVVAFHKGLGDDYGRYLDNGTILINNLLQGNDEEILKVTAHEAVHYLQLEKGILIGELSPIHWNPKLNQEQSDLIEEIVKDQYEEEDWKWEIPAWSLQYEPLRVLEMLAN